MLYKAARRKEKQGPAAGAAANKKKTLKNNNEKKRPLSLYKVESQSTFTSFTAFASAFPLIRATLKFHAIHVSAPAVSPCLSLLSSLWPHHKMAQQQESNVKKSLMKVVALNVSRISWTERSQVEFICFLKIFFLLKFNNKSFLVWWCCLK